MLFKRQIVIAYRIKCHRDLDRCRHPAQALQHFKGECLIVTRFDGIRTVEEPVPHSLQCPSKEHVLVPEQDERRVTRILALCRFDQSVIESDIIIRIGHELHINTGTLCSCKKQLIDILDLRRIKKSIYDKNSFFAHNIIPSCLGGRVFFD